MSLVQYEADGKVYLRSDNPNYQITLTPGRVNSLSYPSPETSAKIIIGVIVTLAAALFVFVLFLEKERILDFFAIVKFRLVSRKRRRAASFNHDAQTTPKEIFHPEIPSYTAPEAKKSREEFPEDEGKLDGDELPEDEGKLDGDEAPEDESEGENARESEGETEFDGEVAHEGEDYPHKSNDAPSREINGMSSERADELISDSLAKDLVKKGREVVYTEGNAKSIINVDTISASFLAGERVDVNSLKAKSLVPYDTAYLKVLARGIVDKPLSVYANDFSLSAVKMIALAGGKSVKASTVTKRKSGEKSNFDKRS